MASFVDVVRDKKVLFITTKNIDYIRNSQETRILQENAQKVELIYSDQKKYIWRILEVWVKLLRYNMKEIDVVFVGFAPQLILPVWGWKFRPKYVEIDFFISVYDTLINDRKRFKAGGLIAQICHYIDRITLKRADGVITDTKADARYFETEFSCEKEKLETLYLEADKTIFYPREQHKNETLKDKFVVLYFGSILPLQGVDVVLDAIRLLKDNDNIHFQIIGPIPKKYSKPEQKNVEYIEWLSQAELAEYIANADLCLAGHFSGDIDKARRTIPGKAYIYDAMRKTMVLGDSVANHELYDANNENVCFVELGNPEELVNKIRVIAMI